MWAEASHVLSVEMKNWRYNKAKSANKARSQKLSEQNLVFLFEQFNQMNIDKDK